MEHCSIVNDTGLGENFVVESPAVAVRTADGDFQQNGKMIYPNCTVSLQDGRTVVVKQPSPTWTVIFSSMEKQLCFTCKSLYIITPCLLGKRRFCPWYIASNLLMSAGYRLAD